MRTLWLSVYNIAETNPLRMKPIAKVKLIKSVADAPDTLCICQKSTRNSIIILQSYQAQLRGSHLMYPTESTKSIGFAKKRPRFCIWQNGALMATNLMMR